jgi:hypothetical protein
MSCRINEDQVTPLHQAATEGQLECLKVLLENKADPFTLDYRNQMPLDLAKLWGHRQCAKYSNCLNFFAGFIKACFFHHRLLAASMWHTEKLLTFKQESLNKRLKTQDVLLEIERAHTILHENKKKSTKKFDNWLNTQSFIKPEMSQTNSKKLPKLKNSYDSENDDERTPRKEQQNIKKRIVTSSAAHSDVTHLFHRSQEIETSDLKQTDIDDETKSQWNYSTKVNGKSYIKNLDDFYPRDQYTCLPPDGDLLLLHHQLSGLTLDEVKSFMKKNLKEREEFLKIQQNKIDKSKYQGGKKKKIKNSASSSSSLKSKRTVMYKPKNVLDYETKARPLDDFSKINDAAFTLSEDPTSFYYQETRKIVNKSDPVLNQKKKNVSFSRSKKNVDDKFKSTVETYFNNDLYEFMKTKNGNINPKYEKVFIC